MSGTGQAWRLQALLSPEVRIDQLETLHPSPHSRTILGETGTGDAASGRKQGHSETRGSHEEVSLPHNPRGPHPRLRTRRDGAFNFRENQSEKSGPEACDGGRGEQCQGVPTGAEIFGSKRVGGGLKTSLEGG